MSASNQLPILIADDQRDVLEALRLLLKTEGMASVCVGSPDAALEAVRGREFAAVLMDLNYTRDTTSGQEGMELLEKVRAIDADLPVVVMTAWGTIDLAVRAMRLGAGDFIEKPWENNRLMTILRNQVALGESRRQARRLERAVEILSGGDDEEFIANSKSMQPVLEMIRRVAPSDANVLILGENGTGKGVVADRLHRASARAAMPFVKVNMGAIAESVFESEMFG
ncbi:MAG TPA: response regulator, partial [Xanthomonadales bacterium]|nr:response regulator [Xanthomonadales bacterium]